MYVHMQLACQALFSPRLSSLSDHTYLVSPAVSSTKFLTQVRRVSPNCIPGACVRITHPPTFSPAAPWLLIFLTGSANVAPVSQDVCPDPPPLSNHCPCSCFLLSTGPARVLDPPSDQLEGSTGGARCLHGCRGDVQAPQAHVRLTARHRGRIHGRC